MLIFVNSLDLEILTKISSFSIAFGSPLGVFEWFFFVLGETHPID